MKTFKDLGLIDEIVSAVSELGYEHPMPVQEKSIEFLLNNIGDVVALAQTGTGKTAAFGLPILQMVDAHEKHTQALALAPTRELCIQIANDLKNYSKHIKGMKVVPVYGGESIVNQFKQLDVPPQILVATPGRLIDLIERGKVDLSRIKFLVLDEADEMLNMGFQDDIETILQTTPENRRTLLYSATMPKEVMSIARKYMKEAEEITIGKKNSGSENVAHVFYMVQAKQRYLALKRIVDMNPDIYGIVFCRTRQETKEIAEHLMKDGYNADALHGDLSQAQRDTVMKKFRLKNLQLLVATDVAARGLDVNNLTHVINYNLPDDVEVYTHRSGRTGRAGKTGVSVTIIHTRERNRIREIEKMINKTFEQEMIPNGLDVCKKQLMHLVEKLDNVHVNEEQIGPFLPAIMHRFEHLSKEELITRFVSEEFNRFLDYYKDAVDLNVQQDDRGREKRGERGERGDRPERERRGDADAVRFKLDIGSADGISPKRLLGILNDITEDKTIRVDDIDITSRNSFFNVPKVQADKVVKSFADQEDVQLTVVSSSRGGGRGSRDGGRGRSDDRGGFRGNRSSGQGRGGDDRKRSGGYGDRDRKDRNDRGGDRGGYKKGGDRQERSSSQGGERKKRW